jgi:hypothetical protein
MAVAGWTRPDVLMRYTQARAAERAAAEARGTCVTVQRKPAARGQLAVARRQAVRHRLVPSQEAVPKRRRLRDPLGLSVAACGTEHPVDANARVTPGKLSDGYTLITEEALMPGGLGIVSLRTMWAPRIRTGAVGAAATIAAVLVLMTACESSDVDIRIRSVTGEPSSNSLSSPVGRPPTAGGCCRLTRLPGLNPLSNSARAKGPAVPRTGIPPGIANPARPLG